MAINWTKIYTEYKGKWVALKSDEKTVLDSSDSLSELISKSEKKGYKDQIYTKVPLEITPQIG